MNLTLSVLAIALQLLGVIFLFAAALGLLRFSDPLQRMHAATKAGTIGAGLVLAGTIVVMEGAEGRIIGALAILFLFLTAPIAGHLLGRAAYISGAELVGIEGKDALKGVLARQRTSLERRSMAMPAIIPSLESVRFAIIPPHEELVARRAKDIALANGLAVEARTIIDANLTQTAAMAEQAREMSRAQLAEAVTTVQTLFADGTPKLALFYTEGDTATLIPDASHVGSLLILPSAGCCLHGADVQTPETIAQPSSLLGLPALHAGPVLFTGDDLPPAATQRVVVVDDGTDSIVAGLIWALEARLWKAPKVIIVALPGDDRTASIKRALTTASLDVPMGTVEGETFDGTLVPDMLSDCDAVIVSSLPQHAIEGNNLSWRRFITETWTGEILVMPYRARPGKAPH